MKGLRVLVDQLDIVCREFASVLPCWMTHGFTGVGVGTMTAFEYSFRILCPVTDQTNVHFDDCMKEVAQRIREYNRTADIVECVHRPKYLRNIYDPARMARLGFAYHAMGRPDT